jgi:tartrate dehydrogenase/decarboxylase / D-malate dehydrogenase
VSRRIAVIPGDGVGPEVLAEAKKCVETLGLGLEFEELPWGSAYWHEHGRMMPEDALEHIRSSDAVLLGAVGDPAVPDHVTLWGLLLELRQGLDLWANVRPARLLEGIPCPLAGRGPADVDMLFVRENTEGEYAGIGGRAHRGRPGELATDTAVFTRSAIERVTRYAFEQARLRRGLLISATKSNASRFGYTLWDDVVADVASGFPGVRVEKVLVDALCTRIVRDPASIDVVVASNLFGDILTDLAAALQGGLGMAASANIAPGSATPGLFEPVHGSAPDIAGRGIANPMAAIWSAVLMLEHLGEAEAAGRLMGALEDVARQGPRTRDVGGSGSTGDVGDAVVTRLAG